MYTTENYNLTSYFSLPTQSTKISAKQIEII